MNNEKMLENIRSLCKENNITTTRLEEILGFSQGLISRWKDKTPSLDRVVDIADYFHVSLDELVGRNQNTNPNHDFISNLIYLTQISKAKWISLNEMLYENSYKCIETYCNIKNFNGYPFNKRELNTFVLEYENGFITLVGYLIVNQNAIEQYDMSLYIQPDTNVEPVYQICEQEQLLKLYKCIKKSLFGESPDLLAEDFKQQFISDSTSKILSQITQSIEDSQDDINESELKMLLANKKAKQIFTEVNSPELQQIISMFTDPNMVKTINTAQTLINYFSDIKDKKDKKIV